MKAFELAMGLLSDGFSVVPSGGGESGKAPIIKWEPYQARLPDKKELEHWDFRYNPVLWGIVTGSISGIVVVDADDAETRARIEATGLDPHIETPRGGAHFYFQYPGHPVKTIAGLLPKIDIRADGGFVNVIGRRKDGEYKPITLPARDNLLPWSSLPDFIAKEIEATPADGGTSVPDAIIAEGQRNSHLTSLAGSMRQRDMSHVSIEAALIKENQTRCNPPLPEAEVLNIARSVARYKPHQRGESQPWTKPPAITLPPPELIVVSKVQPEAVKWLWHPYIPFAKLTLLEGDPGVGKSWVGLAIAAAVSLGVDLPQQTNGYNSYCGPVLIASAEDGLADTIRPRLDGMKANITIIHAIRDLFTLDDAGFEFLEKTIADCLPLLVLIDPLVAYLSGEMDINKANQVRYATARMAKLAEKYGPAVVAVRHLTKGTSQKPVYRGLGSIDFTASARSVMMAGSDPDDPNIRGIVHIKSNLAPVGDAIGYELRDNEFFWTGLSDLNYTRITSCSDSGSSKQEAIAFLLDYLADGPQLSNDCHFEAQKTGISRSTLLRARDQLTKDMKILSYRQGEQGKKGGGQWYLKIVESRKDAD